MPPPHLLLSGIFFCFFTKILFAVKLSDFFFIYLKSIKF